MQRHAVSGIGAASMTGSRRVSETLILKLAFDGLGAPLQVTAPAIVRPLLDPVVAAWPSRQVVDKDVPDTHAFATLGPVDDGRWQLVAPLAETPVARHDPVDAICDLVVEMSWERLRSRPELLCLHAAAIKFDERLVIFPNARRAGKSLLTATLARLGHAVFSDDFVPLSVEPQSGAICGVANGIAPRLRLPLPSNMPADLQEWMTARIGTANKRYGYLTGCELPISGSEAPIGAVVLLDRDEEMNTEATLEPVTDEAAISALVLQNFGRQVHAGAILSTIASIAQTVPVLRLRYSDVAEAAELLHRNDALTDLPSAALPKDRHNMPHRPAPMRDQIAQPTALSENHLRYRKVVGFVEVPTEDTVFVADAEGFAIQRLNSASAVMWMLLDEPMCASELATQMRLLFEDIPFARLMQDAEKALQFFAQNRLIVPDATDEDDEVMK